LDIPIQDVIHHDSQNQGLELGKEPRINRDVLNLPHVAVNAEFVLLEEVAELLAVDQIDWRGAIPGRLSLCFGREGAGGDQQTLVDATELLEIKHGSWTLEEGRA
jgi:hypothetical protein